MRLTVFPPRGREVRRQKLERLLYLKPVPPAALGPPAGEESLSSAMVLAGGLEVVAIGALGNALRKTELGSRVASNMYDAYSYVASTVSEAIGTEEEEPEVTVSPPVQVNQHLRTRLLPQLRVDPVLAESDGDGDDR